MGRNQIIAMKKFKKICVALALVVASTSFFNQTEADAICFLVRYNYTVGDCGVNGEVMCRYCET